jgi:hypothetical protein
MPIYLEISRLHRCATIVARGRITPDEIMGTAQQLLQANVPEFAKVVDTSGASTEVNPEQVERIAALLRGGPDVKRGPVAFLVDRNRGAFARAFKATQGDRPVQLFHSLREARAWLQQIAEAERRAAAGAWADSTPWNDPDRLAVMFRHGQRRAVAVRRPTHAAA